MPLRTAILIFACSVSTTAAQDVGVELRLESLTLEPGEMVRGQILCTNTGDPGRPRLNQPKGLRVTVSPTPNRLSQQTWINGRASSQTTYTFGIQVVADSEGTFTLGPVTVEAGNSTYQSDALTIVVRKAPVSNSNNGDQILWANVEVNATDVFVSQTVTATLTFGVRKIVIDRRTYNLNVLRDVLTTDSQYSVFSGGTVTHSERRLRDSSGESQRYDVYTVRKQIRADDVGELLIGPVFLKANYPTRLRRGFFNRLEMASSRRESARADAIVVHVKPPPADDRPPSFAGAIGRYRLDVTAKPTRVTQGQPVTLTVKIIGAPLAGIAGPNLSRQPELASRFEFTRDELVGEIERGSRVFRRAIFPKQSGDQTIPSIRWSFFDPHRETFVTLSSDPIPISVDPPAAGTGSATFGEPDTATERTTNLTLLAGGISANYVDPGAVLASQAVLPSIGWSVTLVAPPVMWLAIALGVGHRRRVLGDKGFDRRRRAVRRAEKGIRLALRQNETKAKLAELSAALTGYIGDRFNLAPGECTPRDVKTHLIQRGLADEEASSVSDFLSRTGETRYTPGSKDHVDIADVAKQIRRWMRVIERRTR